MKNGKRGCRLEAGRLKKGEIGHRLKRKEELGHRVIEPSGD
jgi:hypothetical protein